MKLWILYCLILTLTLIGYTASRARSPIDLLFPLLLTPALYYLYQDASRYNKKLAKSKPQKSFDLTLPQSSVTTTSDLALEGEVIPSNVSDSDRRLFLKLIGSTGLTLTLMAIFTKDAKAAFFGSVPGPGTVAVKNSAGDTIDPAEAQPTDGYEIAEVDDSASPSYYGFLHKSGAWYITKEDSSGGYRYAKGSSAFSTGWSGRALLSYDYFDAVF